MYFLLFYQTVPQFLEKRTPFREVHLLHAQNALKRGELLMGGALENPADKAVLLFQGPDDQAVRSFAENDPYVQNGLITHWEVRPWKVVIGG